jgi:hypothetical protein
MSRKTQAPERASIAHEPITQDVAAVLTDLSQARISQLKREGYFPKALTVGSLISGLQRYWADEARRSSKSAASSRKDDARARLLELKIAEQEHRLIDIEESEEVLDELIGMFKWSLLGLGKQVTRDVVLIDKIEQEANAILQRCSDLCAARSRELATTGTVAEAVEAVD